MSEVTKVEVFPLKAPKGKIVAFGKITFNGNITIDGVKIISGTKGLFVGMPSTKSKEGTYSDVVLINDKKLKQEINDKMIQAYNDGDAVPANEGMDDDLPF